MHAKRSRHASGSLVSYLEYIDADEGWSSLSTWSLWACVWLLIAAQLAVIALAIVGIRCWIRH